MPGAPLHLNPALVSDIPSVEWGYESIPQKHLKDRIIKLSAAKALGGCQVVFSLELKQLH